MSNVINFSDAQTEKLKKEKMNFDALMGLTHQLQENPAENHTEIIHAFLENFRQDDKFMSRTLKIIAIESQLKAPMEKALRSLTYEDREQILSNMEAIWPKETDAISRLRHILKLYHFCSKQVPKLPFFNIIPRSVIMKFLLAAQRD